MPREAVRDAAEHAARDAEHEIGGARTETVLDDAAQLGDVLEQRHQPRQVGTEAGGTQTEQSSVHRRADAEGIRDQLIGLGAERLHVGRVVGPIEGEGAVRHPRLTLGLLQHRQQIGAGHDRVVGHDDPMGVRVHLDPGHERVTTEDPADPLGEQLRLVVLDRSVLQVGPSFGRPHSPFPAGDSGQGGAARAGQRCDKGHW